MHTGKSLKNHLMGLWYNLAIVVKKKKIKTTSGFRACTCQEHTERRKVMLLLKMAGWAVDSSCYRNLPSMYYHTFGNLKRKVMDRVVLPTNRLKLMVEVQKPPISQRNSTDYK